MVEARGLIFLGFTSSSCPGFPGISKHSWNLLCLPQIFYAFPGFSHSFPGFPMHSRDYQCFPGNFHAFAFFPRISYAFPGLPMLFRDSPCLLGISHAFPEFFRFFVGIIPVPLWDIIRCLLLLLLQCARKAEGERNLALYLIFF